MEIEVSGYTFVNGKAVKWYNCAAIARLIEYLGSKGYEYQQIYDGCLGYGTFIMWSPDPARQYSFIVREIPLNCWTSGHTIRRFSKVTKKLQAEIDAAEAEQLAEETKNA